MKDISMQRMAEAYGTSLSGLAGKISCTLAGENGEEKVAEMFEEASPHLNRTAQELADLASDLMSGYRLIEDAVRLRRLYR